MAAEVFIDTSGFYAQWDRNDPVHEHARAWLKANRGKFIAVTTEWVIGETCTLLMARKAPHLIAPFLADLSATMRHRSINPVAETLDETKRFLRTYADQGYSFVDCLACCVMNRNRVLKALNNDLHFPMAGFHPTK